MNRRGFLGSMLAACAAPAIVRADSLMRVIPLETAVLTAPVGLDEAALNGLIRRVWEAGGDPDIIRCGDDVMRRIDEWYGAATRIDTRGRSVTQTSVYVSDYGCSRILVDPKMPPGRLLVESSGGYARASL